MSETDLFRVLDVDDDRLLFVPVGDPTGGDGDGDASGAPSSESTPSGSADPTPGVPDGGGSTPGGDDAVSVSPDRSYEPVAVPRSGHGEADAALADLLPGYLVRAELSWADAEPGVASVTVRKRTLFAFADDVVNLFEAATATWQAATARGEAMGSRVTRGTDGRPNGVLYVFADPDGVDRLAEFRTGRRPLEPLLARVNATAPDADPGAAWREDGPSVSVGPGGIHVDDGTRPQPAHGLGPDREVFVLRPAAEPFVVVLVALRKAGTLANTVRETYHCPRPDET